eukprot:SAG31_NODE_260_length_18915_cov_3.432823_11_plen_340_part_00
MSKTSVFYPTQCAWTVSCNQSGSPALSRPQQSSASSTATVLLGSPTPGSSNSAKLAMQRTQQCRTNSTQWRSSSCFTTTATALRRVGSQRGVCMPSWPRRSPKTQYVCNGPMQSYCALDAICVLPSLVKQQLCVCVHVPTHSYALLLVLGASDMHCTKSDPPSLRACVDSASAVGFEMVIISFGAGFNLESTDTDYIGEMRAISDYASERGIEMGGYDLLAHTRGRAHNASVECIHCTLGADGKSTCSTDGSTCLASQGSDTIFADILSFVNKTKWGSVETDGPYEGESCASTTHSHHTNLADSVYNNWRRNMEFYHSLVATGVYINAPDPVSISGQLQ